MKTVHKIKRKNKGFSMVDNALIRREDIGFCARGILQFMLSHTEEWEMNMSMLEDKTTESRMAVKRAVWELESAGYATRHQIQNSKTKRFHGTVWVWHEEPVPVSQRTKKPDGGRPHQKPVVGSPEHPLPVRGKEGPSKKIILEDHIQEDMVSMEEDKGMGDNGWITDAELDSILRG